MSCLEGAIAHSKRLQIDECEIISIRKETTTVRITDSEIAETKQNIEKSFGTRLIHQKRIYTHQTSDEDSIIGAMDKMLQGPRPKAREFWRGLPHKTGSHGPLDGTFDDRLDRITGSEASDIAQEMINSALDSRIDAVSGSLNIVSEGFEICNSNGLAASDRATYIAGMINSESGELSASGFGHQSCRTLGAFRAESIGNDSRRMCLESAAPGRCDDQRCTIILEPYSVGELLAFVAYPNFGLKPVSEGRSCLARSLGSSIAPKEFSMADDPHIPQGIGTKPFDDEGTATRRNVLVRDGVFEGVFSNLYDGYREGSESSGNATRPGLPMGRDASPVPSSAPHNLRVTPGSMSTDEMIRDTADGLLVGRLWYTYSLNPTRGDFACTARSGIRIIKGGRIAGPGKPVRIIHSLPELLRDISGVGRDAKNVLQWASIPSITPAIRIEGIRVEGI